ncbi:MAG: hypothetical protein JNK75_06780 [Betaproteobacteria bacterium]|nr:hypothetical protein [Betaproteobacteria bacterium]
MSGLLDKLQALWNAPLGPIGALVATLALIVLAFAAALAVMWGIVWCYHRVFSRRTHAAAQAMARELHLAAVNGTDARLKRFTGTLLEFPIEVAAPAWLVPEPGGDGWRIERILAPQVVVRICFPDALPFVFAIDGGIGIESNLKTGDLAFDTRMRVMARGARDAGPVQHLLDAPELRAAIAAAGDTGVRPFITQEGVAMILSERQPARAVQAAREAVHIARLMQRRAAFQPGYGGAAGY